MRHAAAPIRAVTLISWAAVTLLGLSFGVLGAGGLLDLVQGNGGRAGSAAGLPVAVAATPIAGSPVAGSPIATGTAGAGSKVLPSDPVVSPQAVPDGVALPGRAPAAVVARAGKYVAFAPTSIRMPSGRLAAIEPAGVHSDGSLAVPDNSARIGWWSGGAQPGEPYGTVVLAGHVDSAAYGIGVLAEMSSMRPGQQLKIADGVHGQLYQVQQVTEIRKATLAAGTSLFDQDVAHRLVLITCGGPFDRSTHRYRDNIVVVATPLD